MLILAQLSDQVKFYNVKQLKKKMHHFKIFRQSFPDLRCRYITIVLNLSTLNINESITFTKVKSCVKMALSLFTKSFCFNFRYDQIKPNVDNA